MANTKMFDDFPIPTQEDWWEKIKSDLKMSSLDQFDWQIEPDIRISPFISGHPLSDPRPALKSNPSWNIGASVHVLEPSQANKLALRLLNYGTEHLTFDLKSLDVSPNLDELLDQIQLEWISTNFILDNSMPNFPEEIVSHIHRRGFDVGNLNITLQFVSDEETKTNLEATLDHLDTLPPFLGITLGDSGEAALKYKASDIATILNVGNHLLAYTSKRPKVIHPQFVLPIGDDHLANICYMRAIRLAWLNILDAWKIKDPSHPLICCVISETNLEGDHASKISFTSQAISAVVGGADTILMMPPSGDPDASRLHINIQQLLKLESHFDWVPDPAAGSYIIEQCTEKIAQKIWSKFQQLQK